MYNADLKDNRERYSYQISTQNGHYDITYDSDIKILDLKNSFSAGTQKRNENGSNFLECDARRTFLIFFSANFEI